MTTRPFARSLAAALLGAAALLAGPPAAVAEPGAEAFRADFLEGRLDWPAVEARAREEGRVRFYYWGGSDLLNVWMDRAVAPAMKARGITLEPVRLTGTKDAIDLVLAERGAGRGPGEGSVDLVWVNGENFATLHAQDALFGAFVPRLPNARYLALDPEDPRAQPNLSDFGTPTGGREVPWSGEQYLCAYDSDRVEAGALFHDFDGLRAYLQDNPGKFSYVKPPHYLGNTFVQQVIYALNPDGTGAAPFQADAGEIGPEELARLIAPAMEYLQEIEPLLLGAAQGAPRYFEDAAALDGAFLNGEVHFACKFGIYAPATQKATGTYPEGARAFVFPRGAMIRNKSYLAMPDTAPNPAAALVLADWMTSPEAQISKLAATGFPAGIDAWLLEADQRRALDEAAPGLEGIDRAALEKNAAPDTNASLVGIIEHVWRTVIERDIDAPMAEIVRAAYDAAAR